MITFALVDLGGTKLSSCFSSRGRHELCSQTRAKIHSRLVTETEEYGKPPPTYNQATGSEEVTKGTDPKCEKVNMYTVSFTVCFIAMASDQVIQIA
jgi:hypothetical protein